MGIKAVAVYSEPDADALHVREADEAVAIGPAAAAQSYLSIEKIVDACKQTGAEAVHPGYGFLSENRKFAAALKRRASPSSGLTRTRSRRWATRSNPRKLAAEASQASTRFPAMSARSTECRSMLWKISKEIGYPVMIKASAGGGGKGIRIALRTTQDVREGLPATQAEAKRAPASATIASSSKSSSTEPHHIEIQVHRPTSHGNVPPS